MKSQFKTGEKEIETFRLRTLVASSTNIFLPVHAVFNCKIYLRVGTSISRRDANLMFRFSFVDKKKLYFFFSQCLHHFVFITDWKSSVEKFKLRWRKWRQKLLLLASTPATGDLRLIRNGPNCVTQLYKFMRLIKKSN